MRAIPFLVLAFVLCGCPEPDEPQPAPSSRASIPFDIEGTLSFVRGTDTLRTIDIEIADTDSTRSRGLMQRSEIPDDTGMLFVFPAAEDQAFYMANTPRSLDIQFYGADSTLLNVVENTTPYSFDNVLSEGPAQFVVEVPAGYSRRIGLVPGDRITWTTR
ncbi:DUF192 domain-containing protein [Rubrivirga marina]|uniref:DUF192 domain-containing protein n=1 Tax=Rubrivirga marina TaxID=1196024 RepID=A0A271J1D5_9BACT|nr:DUF192 domain-containing protein [Rubrivirga marina]PAP77302.1 hypothetical protein BSZ37_13085 [Rubrivirga marina]